MSHEAQNKKVLKYMLNHPVITTTIAIYQLNITRLGARIFDLKAMGVPINGRMVYSKRSDGTPTRWKEYWIEKNEYVGTESA